MSRDLRRISHSEKLQLTQDETRRSQRNVKTVGNGSRTWQRRRLVMSHEESGNSRAAAVFRRALPVLLLD
ncbi:hypothetical protein FQN60_001588, partial [Etheostoma spectabile]